MIASNIMVEYSRANKRLVEWFYNEGFLVDEHYDELSEVIKKYNESSRDKSAFNLVIAPTMGCNMGCYYCYEDRNPPCAKRARS